jgi:hypothetical protein
VPWPPAAPTGRRRRHGIPSELPITAEAALAVRWRRIRWRRGTKGPLAARFAARRVRVADGPQAQTGRRLPGDAELWLVGERRDQVLPDQSSRRDAAQHTRRDDQGALGVRAGAPTAERGARPRPLRGPLLGHHHALLTMIAFLQHLRLAQSRNRGDRSLPRPAASAEPARRPLLAQLADTIRLRCPKCRRLIILHRLE